MVLNEDGEDINVTDDTAVGEAIDGIEAPYLYVRGDTARMEMYSLTREAYVFWSDVANLIFSDGGVFAPLPATQEVISPVVRWAYFKYQPLMQTKLLLNKIFRYLTHIIYNIRNTLK